MRRVCIKTGLIATLLLLIAATASAQTISIGDVSIAPGETKTVSVVLDQVPATGLSYANITVSITNPSVAEITNIEFPGWVPKSFRDNSTLPASTVWFKVGDLDERVNAGDMNVVLANLTIKGLSEGTSDITITVNSFQNDNYNEIKDRIAVIPGLITVISGPPTGSKDVDGDGLYEDVNGNERLDFGDVVELFKNFEAWQDYGIYYDFDGDGRLTFGDVVALFKMLP
uniref:EF-hand domain-containing protein n=1 Tax=Geoglobus ahangari TaxID=113653 RepID=A0A7C3UD06_9EURY